MARLFVASLLLAIVAVMVLTAYAIGNAALSWDHRARWAVIAITALVGVSFTVWHYGALYHNLRKQSDHHVSFVFPIGGCSLVALSILLPWAPVEKRNECAWLFAFLDPSMFTHLFGALYSLIAPEKAPEP